MILISHRGNLTGKIESYENEPTYIDLSISKGYEVEVDVWFKANTLFLGHDRPQYGIGLSWFTERQTKLWIHCKNIEAIEFFSKMKSFNYFWHENDKITLTSKGFLWAYPTKISIKNSIAVLPELFHTDLKNSIGVCSDFIEEIKFNIN